MRIVPAGSVTLPDLNAAVGRFVSEALWGKPDRIEKFSSVAVFDKDALVAGIVFHNYQPDAGLIEISGAGRGKRWMTRPFLRTVFDIAFRRFGCQMVVFRVSPLNLGMVELCERFGCSAHRIPRLRGRDEDEMIYTFTDDQWRVHPLLKEKTIGQALTSAAA